MGNEKNVVQLSENELDDFRKKQVKILAGHCYFNVHRRFDLHMPNPFYYTILRDPVERFISHYNFFLYKQGRRNCKDIPLDKLDPAMRRKLVREFSNLQVVYLADCKFKSGDRVSQNELNNAKSHLEMNYGCFGILEQIEESINLLKSNLPDWLTFDASFPVTNRNADSRIPRPSQEVIDQIKEANLFDCEFYDFATSLFESKLKTPKTIKAES
jgi:hypothetical protein